MDSIFTQRPRSSDGQTYVNPTLTTPLITSYTWALKPAAASNSGRTIRITDVGDNALWTSNGTNYIPSGGQVLIAQGSVPIGIAPTGTMGANGAVTLGTALGGSYTAGNSSGIWLFFPAGAVASGSAAGFFWTVMTNTTAGTVFNTTYSPVSGTYPTVPSSPTPVVDAGPGAFTGSVSGVTAVTYSLPGGVLSINGSIQWKGQIRTNSSAGAKVMNFTYGGSTTGGTTLTTSTGAQLQAEARNIGVTSKQLGLNFTSAAVGTFTGIDSTTAQNIAITEGHTGAATDFIIIEQWEIWVRP